MKPIRDEPTVEQSNDQMNTWLAGVAFNAVFRENNPDKAKQRLAMMSAEKLDQLIHACKRLRVLAETEYRFRQDKKAVRDD